MNVPNNSYFPPTDDVSLSSIDPKILNEIQYILKDVLAGDAKAQDRPEFRGLNLKQIKLALDYILTNQSLNGEEKNELLSSSWRVNYRTRPPTPEEFLTEKYLGPVAPTIYPYVKEAFIEYLNPTKPYRTCVLYPFIGWGKSYLAVLVNMYIGVHMSLMKAPWKFFGQSQPLGCKVLTPEGFKDMGELSVGEFVLTPENKKAEIIEIHPQGKIPTYEIELDDGRKTRCSAEHLWKVSFRKDKDGKKIWEIVNTQFMLDHSNIDFEIPSYTVNTFVGCAPLIKHEQ